MMSATDTLKIAKAHLAAVEHEVSALRAEMGISPLMSSWPCPAELRDRLRDARNAVEIADKAVGAAHREAIRKRAAA